MMRHRKAIIALLVIFIILAFAYSVVNPLHEATDELRHYRFVRVIATTGRLPVQGQEDCRSQSHHPPLFYVLGALATAWIDTGREVCYTTPENPFWAYRYWEVGRDNKNQYLHGPDEAFPWSGEALAVHIIRTINILIGAGVVLLTWATGLVIWPRKPAIAFGAAALVAFNPMFLYMAGATNNDIIAALSGAAVVYACIRLVDNPAGLNWRWGVLLGALYGLALMSKFNLAVIIVLIEAAVIWAVWKKPFAEPQTDSKAMDKLPIIRREMWKSRLKTWLVANALIILVAGLTAGWWFIRNQQLYGEPTGFQELTELWGVRDPWKSFGLAVSEIPYAWTTFWGRFGFGQIPLPKPIYTGLMITSALALLGALVSYIRQASPRERLMLTFLVADVILFFMVLFNYMLVSPAGPNGRFFFPAISALAILIFAGLSYLVLGIQSAILNSRKQATTGETQIDDQPRTLDILARITAFTALALSFVALFGYLAPAYARPPELAAQADIPNPVGARFDNLVTLLGYDLNTTTLRPGEPVDVALYWEVNSQPPGDYLLFLHLQDEANTMVAQRDTHPGLGNFPSSQWRPGDRFVDKVRMYLPETAYAPDTATLSIGLYAPGAYRLEVTDRDGQLIGDSLPLSGVDIMSRSGDYPNLQSQNFGDEIRLVGYEYDQQEVAPGSEVAVTLYWEALTKPKGDYEVKLRMYDEDGQKIVGRASRPQRGESPTNTWETGQIIKDLHPLKILPGTPPGAYPIIIYLSDIVSGRRLQIVADDGHLINDHLQLAQIRVLPE